MLPNINPENLKEMLSSIFHFTFEKAAPPGEILSQETSTIAQSTTGKEAIAPAFSSDAAAPVLQPPSISLSGSHDFFPPSYAAAGQAESADQAGLAADGKAVSAEAKPAGQGDKSVPVQANIGSSLEKTIEAPGKEAPMQAAPSAEGQQEEKSAKMSASLTGFGQDSVESLKTEGSLNTLQNLAAQVKEQSPLPFLAKQDQLLASSDTKPQETVMSSLEYRQTAANANPATQVAELGKEPLYQARVELANGLDNIARRVSEGDFSLAKNLATLTGGAAITVTSLAGTDLLAHAALGPQKLLDIPSAAFAQMALMIPSDPSGALGLIGALFTTGAAYSATAENAASIASKQGRQAAAKPKTKQFAKRFAEKMIGLIAGQEIHCFTKKEKKLSKDKESGEQDERERRKEHWAEVIKIALLSNTLAFLYKSETGKITSEEFIAMLNGLIPLAEGSIEASVAKLLAHFLTALPLPKQKKMLSALLSYMDSDPNFDSLTTPQALFTEVMTDFRDASSIPV